MCSTRHFIGSKKGARRQIGEDLLRLGIGSLWGHFAAPPHSPKSLVLWTAPNFKHLYFQFLGVLDQDAPDIVLESKPRLYVRGRESHVYKPYSFWLNMVDSLYQSLVIFFVSYGAYFNSDVGLWEFGTAIITSCLCTMLIHQAVETKSWVIFLSQQNPVKQLLFVFRP